MAKVMAKVLGGDPQEVEAKTVEEAKAALGLEGNYTATVNGQPAEGSTVLTDYQVVNFSEAVKGGGGDPEDDEPAEGDSEPAETESDDDSDEAAA